MLGVKIDKCNLTSHIKNLVKKTCLKLRRLHNTFMLNFKLGKELRQSMLL